MIVSSVISLRLASRDGRSSVIVGEDEGTARVSLTVEVVSGSAEIDIDLTDSIVLTSASGSTTGMLELY